MRGTEITSGNWFNALLASNTRRHSCLPLLLLLALLGGCRSERVAFRFVPLPQMHILNVAPASQEARVATQEFSDSNRIVPAGIALQPLTHLKEGVHLSPSNEAKVALKNVAANYKFQRHAQPTARTADNWDKVGYFLLCAIIGLLLIILGLATSNLPVALIGLGIGVLGAILFLH